MGVSGKTLVVVDGPSGAGKSCLLRWASERHEGVVAIPKLTTRPRREGESGWSDLIHVPAAEFGRHLLDYVYSWNGHRYGFSRAHLHAKLRAARLGLIVVRHEPTTRRLASDLPGVRVVSVRVDAAPAVRRERLLADGWSAEQADRVLAGEPASSSSELETVRIVNEGSLGEFQRRVDSLIARYGGLYGEPDR